MNIPPSLNHLLTEVNRLSSVVDRLDKEVSAQRKEKEAIKQENRALLQKNQDLKQENQTLKRELEQVKTRKNSNNSHIPPSQDMARKNKSLRKKSGRKPGGQTGHDGHTLKMVDTPDQVKDYHPNYCEGCGADLSRTPAVLLGSRQTIEIPPIKPITLQHNVYGKVCNCGYCTEATFPESATAPIGYGASVHGLASYLHTRQYLPYERMRELFNDVLGISMSGGTLRNIIHRAAGKALPYYKEIKKRLQNSASVGSDETSIKVDREKNWTCLRQAGMDLAKRQINLYYLLRQSKF